MSVQEQDTQTSRGVGGTLRALGRMIGGKSFAQEASQSLGQKNTTFTIYLALTYANPLVAFGPTSYVLWHNLWIAWQLHLQARAEATDSSITP